MFSARPTVTVRCEEGASRFLPGYDRDGREIAVHTLEFAPPVPAQRLLFLLPFTGAHSGQMVPIAREMSRRGCHTLCIDPPGHGRSGGERGRFSIEGLFRTIRSVVEHCHASAPQLPVTLAGSSWGGDLSLLYALWEQRMLERRHQIRLVDSVLCQAVLTPWQRDLFVRYRRGIGLLFESTGIGKWMLQRLLGRVLTLPRMFRLRDVYHSARNRQRFVDDALTLRGYSTADYLDYLTYLPENSLESVRIPIHLLIGEEDRLVPVEYEREVFRRIHAANPDSTLTVLPGASHALFEENVSAAADSACRLLGMGAPPASASGNRRRSLPLF